MFISRGRLLVWTSNGARTSMAIALALGLVPSFPSVSYGQTAPLESTKVDLAVDSGAVVALDADADTSPQIVFMDVVGVAGSPWVRLHFDEKATRLSGLVETGNASIIQLTSMHDGAMQKLDAQTLKQWRYSSAYFNGDLLIVQVLAYPGTGENRVKISAATAGVAGDGGIASICGMTDDRTPSSDPRVGRIRPAGCTGWLIDQHCLLTAGHCTSDSAGVFVPDMMDVIEFNVPLSDPDGQVNFADPSDQYAIDPTSIQFTSAGVGNDWCLFGAYSNANTTLSPMSAQGGAFSLASTVPPVDATPLRITGYGIDEDPAGFFGGRNEWSQTQQTHVGTYDALTATTIFYDDVDAMPGNSGSPLIRESTGQAIGIHTHGGCNASMTDSNRGTRIDNAGLQFALASPAGICGSAIGCPFDPECCALVCGADPSCCSNWGPQCDALAHQLCVRPVWAIDSWSGTGYAEACSIDPNVGWPCVLAVTGPNGFDPALDMLQAYANVQFSLTQCPSVAEGLVRVRVLGMNTPMALIKWKVLSNVYWNCTMVGPGNEALGNLNDAEVHLKIENAPAGTPLTVHYQWRLYSYSGVEHESPNGFPEDLPNYIINGKFDINGTSMIVPGSFDIFNMFGLIVEPREDGMFTVMPNDTVKIHLNAHTKALITEPGDPPGGSAFGWEDQGHSGFVGALFLSLNGPIPPGGPFDGTPGCGPDPCCVPSYAGNSGCNNTPCCQSVCAVDPFCCNVEWDLICARLAACDPLCGCPCCPWDLNGNGLVNGQDYTLLLGMLGPCPPGVPCQGDLNGDGRVTRHDLAVLKQHLGACP